MVLGTGGGSRAAAFDGVGRGTAVNKVNRLRWDRRVGRKIERGRNRLQRQPHARISSWCLGKHIGGGRRKGGRGRNRLRRQPHARISPWCLGKPIERSRKKRGRRPVRLRCWLISYLDVCRGGCWPLIGKRSSGRVIVRWLSLSG